MSILASNRMGVSKRRKLALRERRGGVMLLCMLAAVVISTAVLGLAQSHRRSVMRIESRRATTQATQESGGLYQRAIAVLRNDGKFSGRIDPGIKSVLGNYAVVTPTSKKEITISVFAYDKAAVPVIETIVDSKTLQPTGAPASSPKKDPKAPKKSKPAK